jgi:hypothetical protein
VELVLSIPEPRFNQESSHASTPISAQRKSTDILALEALSFPGFSALSVSRFRVLLRYLVLIWFQSAEKTWDFSEFLQLQRRPPTPDRTDFALE